MPMITDFIVQDHMEEEDNSSYLHVPLFNVNTRLYKTSRPYKEIISNIIEYMKSMFDMKFSDYGGLKGLSGANIGIPFNIIVVSEKYNLIVMINPKIIDVSSSKTTRKSNCGSLRLSKSIDVMRHNVVRILFLDTDMEEHIIPISGPVGSTVQHEIDHNNGITIEDRVKEV